MVKRVLKKAGNLKLTRLFREFYQKLASGGLLLVICAAASLYLANSAWAAEWTGFWNISLDLHIPGLHAHSLTHWINDGLMTIFFLLVGLEIERELLVGELSDRRTALLPVIAAVGGMAIPALTYLLLNINHPENLRGAGIPTATDIAFAIAIMGALGPRVPAALKVFLTALAIIDDLGAILVIAIFYGQGIQFAWLLAAIAFFALLFLLKRMGVQSLWVYLPAGVLLWYFMMQSGIHATLAGVMLAFAIPFGKKDEDHSPSGRLMDKLHEPVAWIILPLFALANTAIPVSAGMAGSLLSAMPLGVAAGLIIGKPLGIFLASWLSLKSGITRLPGEVSQAHLWGAGMLGGIGFTMAMFVANLAFDSREQAELAKFSVLLASTLAAVMGYLFLRLLPKK